MLMISCGGCIELYYAKHVGLLFEELFTCTIIDNNVGLEKSSENLIAVVRASPLYLRAPSP